MTEQERCEHEVCGAENRLEYCVGNQERNYIDAEVVTELIDEILYSFDVSHDDYSFTGAEEDNRLERSFSVLCADEGETPELSVQIIASQGRGSRRNYSVEIKRGGSFNPEIPPVERVTKYKLEVYSGQAFGTVQGIDYIYDEIGKQPLEFIDRTRDISSYDFAQLFDDLYQIYDVQEIERADNENVARCEDILGLQNF